MNSVLLIPCVGPMQSWGSRSRFQVRDTEREPTKSGVIGLLAAALGRDRSADLSDLSALVFAVRADREGIVRREFQTIQSETGPTGGDSTTLSERMWLADAAFLVGLEGAAPFLETLHTALRTPVYPLYLGRKSYVPSIPFYLPDGLIVNSDLRTALLRYPLLDGAGDGADTVRFVWSDGGESGEIRMDEPESFSKGNRRYRFRFVRTEWISRSSIGKEGK